mmetsp:Transcript_20070/g.20379  ORF Transcript_20070/g.20379 Transcript_20070/m.20379 type:complete len:91 (-) Transcript_20070:21-293(-)
MIVHMEMSIGNKIIKAPPQWAVKMRFFHPRVNSTLPSNSAFLTHRVRRRSLGVLSALVLYRINAHPGFVKNVFRLKMAKEIIVVMHVLDV